MHGFYSYRAPKTSYRRWHPPTPTPSSLVPPRASCKLSFCCRTYLFCFQGCHNESPRWRPSDCLQFQWEIQRVQDNKKPWKKEKQVQDFNFTVDVFRFNIKIYCSVLQGFPPLRKTAIDHTKSDDYLACDYIDDAMFDTISVPGRNLEVRVKNIQKETSKSPVFVGHFNHPSLDE